MAFVVKDAFGVEKSYVTGVGFRPITQMARSEIDALRAARSMRAQGARGHLGQLIGGEGKPRVTAVDARREVQSSKIMQERKSIADGTTTATRKVGGGTVFGSYDDTGKLGTGAAGDWAPTSSTGPQRRNKGLTLIRRGYNTETRRGIAAHEVAHATRSKPKSAFLRMQEPGTGKVMRLGDEARADHAKPLAQRLDSTYRTASMSRNPIKRFKARRYLGKFGNYAGDTRQQRRQSYKKYKVVTRKLERIERKRG